MSNVQNKFTQCLEKHLNDFTELKKLRRKIKFVFPCLGQRSLFRGEVDRGGQTGCRIDRPTSVGLQGQGRPRLEKHEAVGSGLERRQEGHRQPGQGRATGPRTRGGGAKYRP